MKTQEKIMERKVFKIKPFKTLKVGDPSYFEEMEESSNNKHLKDLTCDIKTRCCKIGSLMIEKKEITQDNFSFEEIDITVCLAENQKQLYTYEAGRYFKDTLKKEYELGCDTAKFEINVDDRYSLIDTYADGYYGQLLHFKQGYGLILSLSLDADMYKFDEVVKRFSYLFEILN